MGLQNQKESSIINDLRQNRSSLSIPHYQIMRNSKIVLFFLIIDEKKIHLPPKILILVFFDCPHYQDYEFILRLLIIN